jgi:hypothetical protein
MPLRKLQAGTVGKQVQTGKHEAVGAAVLEAKV